MTDFEFPGRVFARRLREVREDVRPRLTQRGLAERLARLAPNPWPGTNLDSLRILVSRTESGKRTATVDDLIAFATALEVPPAWLLAPEAQAKNYGLGKWGEGAEDIGRRMDEIQEELHDVERRLKELASKGRDMRDLLKRLGAAERAGLDVEGFLTQRAQEQTEQKEETSGDR